MLGFGGSVLAMIQTLRTNKTLLKEAMMSGELPVLKRVATKEERERRRRNQPQATPELLAEIREQNEVHLKRRKVLILYSIVGAVVMVGVLLYGVSVVYSETDLWYSGVEVSQAEQRIIDQKKMDEVRRELETETPRAGMLMKTGDYFGAMGLFKHLWELDKTNQELANQYMLSTIYFLVGQEEVNQSLLNSAWEDYTASFPNGAMKEELELMVFSCK